MSLKQKLDQLLEQSKEETFKLNEHQMKEVFGEAFEQKMIHMGGSVPYDTFCFIFQEDKSLYQIKIRFNFIHKIYYLGDNIKKNKHVYQKMNDELYKKIYNKYNDHVKEAKKLEEIVLHKSFRLKKLFMDTEG